ncbi:MAG: proton-conducting transporter membrane subunit [Candidatus Bathyarchaeota archaeon]|nr:proton-conducting transporter membrane subunit [Candidatus Bathyarchaeota archaeon]
MISLNLILISYGLVALAVLLCTLLSKSHRIMNILSILLPATYLLLTLFTLTHEALPAYNLGADYFLIDHLSIYEILLSTVLFLFAAVYSRGYIEGSIEIHEMERSNLKLFYVAFNLLLVAITFAFLADNLALFWILAELTTAFSAVLIVILNAPKNIGATLKYIFITSTCMLFAFIGLILLFTMTDVSYGSGTLNWSALMAIASALSPGILLAAFIFTFVGFAAKSGVVPFHAWLPSAHSKAPASVSAILSGSITSVGIYGIIRMYAIAAQNSILPKVSLLLIAFGVLSMVVAALTMLTQVNLKKLIGYSTVENMGFLLVGLGVGGAVAVFWTLFYILAHAFTKASLFFSSGIMHHQYESVRMERIKNAFKLQPFASWTLILGAIAIIGMPTGAVFIPKISILMQSATYSPYLLLGLLVIFLFATAAFGVFLIKLLTNKQEDTMAPKVYRVPLSMKVTIVVLLASVFALGVFFPHQLSDLLTTIVSELGIR